MKKHTLVSLVLGLTAVAAAATLPFVPMDQMIRGADHADAPAAKADAARDITDVYAFLAPDDSSRVVLAMNVNPLTPPGQNPTFDPGTTYSLKVDTDGDAVADDSISIVFQGDSQQHVTVTHNGVEILAGPTAQVPRSGRGRSCLTSSSGAQFFAGLRDDPFFFDLVGFQKTVAAGFQQVLFTGDDTFAGTNISAIVLSVPTAAFGSSNIGVWATTSTSGGVVDQMGRPAINTVFIPADQKDDFNRTKPSDQPAKFRDEVLAVLNLLGADAGLADVLLPDVLTIDLSQPSGFLNGRRLQDDVIDAELQLLLGPDATDGVDANDRGFLSTCPYMAAPHTAPAAGGPSVPTGDGSLPGDPSDGSGRLYAAVAAAGAALLLGSASVWVLRRGRRTS